MISIDRIRNDFESTKANLSSKGYVDDLSEIISSNTFMMVNNT